MTKISIIIIVSPLVRLPVILALRARLTPSIVVAIALRRACPHVAARPLRARGQAEVNHVRVVRVGAGGLAVLQGEVLRLAIDNLVAAYVFHIAVERASRLRIIAEISPAGVVVATTELLQGDESLTPVGVQIDVAPVGNVLSIVIERSVDGYIEAVVVCHPLMGETILLILRLRDLEVTTTSHWDEQCISHLHSNPRNHYYNCRISYLLDKSVHRIGSEECFYSHQAKRTQPEQAARVYD